MMGMNKITTQCKFCDATIRGNSRLGLRVAIEDHFVELHPVAWNTYVRSVQRTNTTILNARKELERVADTLISDSSALTFEK